jgi:hypothetical protein
MWSDEWPCQPIGGIALTVADRLHCHLAAFVKRISCQEQLLIMAIFFILLPTASYVMYLYRFNEL